MLLDMPLFRALALVASAIVLVALTQWRRVHPFVAIVAVACGFAYVAQLGTAALGRVFGVGFSAMIYNPGLVIVAAGLVAGLAESTGAAPRLMGMIAGCRWLPGNWIAAAIGLVAGLGASPAAAFALLSPLLRPIGGKTDAARAGAAVALALAISASHGVAVLSPVAIACVSILGADWGRTALIGTALAILLAGIGAIFARIVPVDAAVSPLDQQPADAPQAGAGTRGGAVALVLATLVPLLMLIVQSLADIPSEPLGGEPGLETIVAMGRPLVLLLVGVGIMIVSRPRQALSLLADSPWSGRILANTSSIVFIVCAAGGFQALCRQTGMAEALGESMLGWHVGAPVGLVVPFLIAATMKTLQGSSLVAAITTAGMVQPLLTPFGLADSNGKVLVTLAVGAGAMTISHVNDEYFWLVTTSAGFSPLRGVATISLGTLLQGLIALAVLVFASVWMTHV
jgi:GntP family gluconate:H+ symporter